jgi:hypothetical protein
MIQEDNAVGFLQAPTSVCGYEGFPMSQSMQCEACHAVQVLVINDSNPGAAVETEGAAHAKGPKVSFTAWLLW